MISDQNARRLFSGVQGDSSNKGELFGITNLFKFNDGERCLTDDIIEVSYTIIIYLFLKIYCIQDMRTRQIFLFIFIQVLYQFRKDLVALEVLCIFKVNVFGVPVECIYGGHLIRAI